jgi:hypothetical protein
MTLTREFVKKKGSNRVKTLPLMYISVKKMVKNKEYELDDLIIKAIGHHERKNILRIVGSYPEGVKYSGILGESGLSTGRLNYHLGELEGFLERDENRLYSLSEIGKKAVATLEFINKDIDLSLLESVNTRRATRLKRIRRRLDISFYVFTVIMMGSTGAAVYLAYVESDSILTAFVGLFVIFAIGLVINAYYSRKKDSERILWIWEWLEWKLVGNYKNRD